jgi:hypothetical protein
VFRYFLVPYATTRRKFGLVRICAMDRLTPAIAASGGEWREVEVAGDRAVVEVRAPDDAPDMPWKAILGQFGELAADDAVAFLADDRNLPVKPRVEGDQLIFDGEIRPYQQGVLALPVPRFGIALFVTPTTRYDGSTMTGLATMDGGSMGMTVSGGLFRSTSGAEDAVYDTTQLWGPDCTCSLDIPTISTSDGFGLFVRSKDLPSATLNDGYFLFVETSINPDGWNLFRIDNSAFTQLGATVSGPTLASGDKIGLEAIGSAIAGYRFTAGAWGSAVLSRTDATYGAAGNVGFFGPADTTWRADNFAIDTIAASAAAVQLARPRSSLICR